MSEPTVSVPARALLAAIKHLHHAIPRARCTAEANALKDTEDELTEHLVDGCSMSELEEALVACRIQEATETARRS